MIVAAGNVVGLICAGVVGVPVLGNVRAPISIDTFKYASRHHHACNGFTLHLCCLCWRSWQVVTMWVGHTIAIVAIILVGLPSCLPGVPYWSWLPYVSGAFFAFGLGFIIVPAMPFMLVILMEYTGRADRHT